MRGVRGWTTGRAALMVILLLSSAAIAAKTPATEPDMTVDRDGHGGYVVNMQNPLPFPITVTLSARKLENLHPSRPLPITAVIDPFKTTTIARMSPIEAHEQTRISTSYQWQPGRPDAEPDDSFVYTLPFEAGCAYYVSQGYNGSYSHQHECALDFSMPDGSPVCAARDGRVVSVTQTFAEGGTDPQLRDKCNEFTILHSDGTLARYAHLQKNGIELRVGDQIRAGYPLGKSGNTGFSAGPHLHFDVIRVVDGAKHETVPVKFATADAQAITLEARRLYMRPFRDQKPGETRTPRNAAELAKQAPRMAVTIDNTRAAILSVCVGLTVIIVARRDRRAAVGLNAFRRLLAVAQAVSAMGASSDGSGD